MKIALQVVGRVGLCLMRAATHLLLLAILLYFLNIMFRELQSMYWGFWPDDWYGSPLLEVPVIIWALGVGTISLLMVALSLYGVIQTFSYYLFSDRHDAAQKKPLTKEQYEQFRKWLPEDFRS